MDSRASDTFLLYMYMEIFLSRCPPYDIDVLNFADRLGTTSGKEGETLVHSEIIC